MTRAQSRPCSIAQPNETSRPTVRPRSRPTSATPQSGRRVSPDSLGPEASQTRSRGFPEAKTQDAKAKARTTSHASSGTALTPATLYVRVRPMGTEGGHTVKNNAECVHQLKSYTEDCVTMVDSARRVHDFEYPTKVILPEETQQQMYDSMMVSNVHSWISDNTNVMILAYGQTGTGKTHTIIGPQESLKNHDVHPDWGILPRVAHTCLTTMEANKRQKSYILTASAVDFYLGMCSDLLNSHGYVEVDPAGTALGLHSRILGSMEDFYAFLDEVRGNRITVATKMNSESSRSHCAIRLSLYQLDHQTRMFSLSKFNLFDLAGSERADKTGEKRAGFEDVWDIMSGKVKPQDASIAVQAYVINFELTWLATEILRATEQYKNGRKYNPPRSGSSPMQRYVGQVLTGYSVLNTCICISPAAQNGSENLFSLKWGQNMAALRSPVHNEKPIPIERAYKIACDHADSTAKELQMKDKANKFFNAYTARAGSAQQKKEYLDRLMSSMASSA